MAAVAGDPAPAAPLSGTYLGLPEDFVDLEVTAAETLSAHTFATGILGAAIRLGLLGHVGAQRILQDARVLVARLLREPAPDLDDLCASTPEAEIAVMRHETAATRLFAN